MSKFNDIVKQDTPRVVVLFSREGDNESFQWGAVGQIPTLTLVGYIVRIQAELAFREPEECPESALVIAWNPELCEFKWFVHKDIPVDSLVGMLETIKTMIIRSHVNQQEAVQQSPLIGPDGRPLRSRI